MEPHAQVAGDPRRGDDAEAVADDSDAATEAPRRLPGQTLASPLLGGGEAAALRDVAHQLAAAVKAASCSIYLLVPEREELLLAAAWSAGPAEAREGSAASAIRLAEVPELADVVHQKRVVRTPPDQAGLPASTRRWMSSIGVSTMIAVPVESMGAVSGCVLLFDRTDRRALSEDETELLAALGAPVGAALSSARRLRAEKERSRQLDSLLTSIRAMTSGSTLTDVLDVVAVQAGAALSVPSCVIYEYVVADDKLVLRADLDCTPGSGEESKLGTAFDLSEYPFDRELMANGEIVQQWVTDEDLDEATRQTMLEFGERSCLSVPLLFKGEAVGLLELIETRWERDFTEAERAMAHAIGEQAAAAIVNARLFRDQELHARRLASLLEVSRTVASSMELPELLERLARVSAEALGTRLCVVLELDKAADRLVFRAGFDRQGKADDAYWAGFNYSLDEYPGEREILSAGHPVVELASDPDVHPLSRAGMEAWGQQTYLNVQLAYADEQFGLLQFIETDYERAFSKEELDFAEGLGEQVAVAIHDARRYRELVDATDALENQLQLHHNLLELSERLLTLRDREAVCETIAGVLGTLLAYESLDISLVDHETAELVEVFESEGSVNVTLGTRIPLGVGVCGHVIQSGQPEMVNDMLRDPRAVQVPGTDEEEQASIIVPLQVAGEIIGVLTVSRFDGRVFVDREFQVVQLVTNLTAIAIQNARLYDEVQDKAVRDGLTGLYNHRHFYERLAQEVARSRRYETPLSLLMIDLDDFKHYNDRCGHVKGDEALSVVARCLAAEVRHDVDIVARYGGEEFAVLLPNTACYIDRSGEAESGEEGRVRPGCAASAVAERIRARVAREVLGTLPDGSGSRLTVSIGIATLPDMAYDEQQLVAHADKALYLAKRLGKNRLEIYEP